MFHRDFEDLFIALIDFWLQTGKDIEDFEFLRQLAK